METKQAIVLPSGWEAQVENPFENFAGPEEAKQFMEFSIANPARPLTKEHTPGAKVEVREVWQYQFRDSDDWFTTTTTDIEAFEEYADFMYQNFDAATRVAFEVASEEESSNLSKNSNSSNSVEEAAEKSYPSPATPNAFSFCNGFVTMLQRMAFKKGANWESNHIIQSGEYVLKSDVDKRFETAIAILKDKIGKGGKIEEAIVKASIRLLEIMLDDLTTLKNNK